MTKESQALVQRVRLLGRGYQELQLAITETLFEMRPGQCVLARPKALRVERVWHPYLRAAWYPTHLSRKLMTVEVQTRNRFEPGDVIDIVGPVGKPFIYRRTLRNVLLLVYNTPPFPLLMAIPVLLGQKVSVTMVLLGTATDYPTHHLPPEVEIVRGDNPAEPLSWPDQVITIGWADQVFAVVPPSDELAYFEQLYALFQQRRTDVSQGYLNGIFQAVTPCGVGACEACMVKVGEAYKLACVDGPSFDLSQILG
jgi:NAD(P)H-flavin reductase